MRALRLHESVQIMGLLSLVLTAPVGWAEEPREEVCVRLYVEEAFTRFEHFRWDASVSNADIRSDRGDYELSFPGSRLAQHADCCPDLQRSELAEIECHQDRLSIRPRRESVQLVRDRFLRRWYLVDVDHYQKAWTQGIEELLTQERWVEAFSWMDRLKRSPEIAPVKVAEAQARIHLKRGMALYGKNDFVEAAYNFNRALDLRGHWTEDVEICMWHFASLYQAGEYGLFLARFEDFWTHWFKRWKTDEVTPKLKQAFARVFYYRARIAMGAEGPGTARHYFQRAVDDLPPGNLRDVAQEYLNQLGSEPSEEPASNAVSEPTPTATEPDRHSFTLTGYGETRDIHLEELAGRPVLVHFWATWCVPCRREMPEVLEFLKDRYPELEERGLEFLTVTNDLRKQDVDPYLEGLGHPFPVYFDAEQRVNERLGVGRTLPATVLLDAQGNVVETWGSVPWNDDTFQQLLTEILKESDLDKGGS